MSREKKKGNAIYHILRTQYLWEKGSGLCEAHTYIIFRDKLRNSGKQHKITRFVADIAKKKKNESDTVYTHSLGLV